MSEGQLKKRMLQGMHDFSLHDPENLTNEMFEFIDEAKKEWLTKFPYLTYTKDDDAFMLQQLADILEFINKWFGDST